MHMQWQLQRHPLACLSGGVDSKLSLYFKIRAPRASSWCLLFNLDKMAAVSVTVLKKNMALCQRRHLQVSDVDMSLLSMLKAFLLILETSESVMKHLHSGCTAASVEGIRLDAAPNDKVSPHVKFGTCHVFFKPMQSFALRGHDSIASQQPPACTINYVVLEAASEMQQPLVPKSGPQNWGYYNLEWNKTKRDRTLPNFQVISKKVLI